jgi:RNA polymerase sigma-70 factor (ECF subfamily)
LSESIGKKSQQGATEDAAVQDANFGAHAVEIAFNEHAADLKRFLLGLLRDDASADDALQATFASLLESDPSLENSELRRWLFKVGYNQAMLIRRQAAVQAKHASEVWRITQKVDVDPAACMEQRETTARVRRAIEELSEDQRKLVTTRIQGDLKFREIAENLGVPLGTVLGRMQSALKKVEW